MVSAANARSFEWNADRPRFTVDNDVRFTVYRPERMWPGRWSSLLVFAHKTDTVFDPVHGSVDPVEQVQARARAHLGRTCVGLGGE